MTDRKKTIVKLSGCVPHVALGLSLYVSNEHGFSTLRFLKHYYSIASDFAPIKLRVPQTIR